MVFGFNSELLQLAPLSLTALLQPMSPSSSPSWMICSGRLVAFMSWVRPKAATSNMLLKGHLGPWGVRDGSWEEHGERQGSRNQEEETLPFGPKSHRGFIFGQRMELRLLAVFLFPQETVQQPSLLLSRRRKAGWVPCYLPRDQAEPGLGLRAPHTVGATFL